MSWKKCSKCGDQFDGGFFDSSCPECKRQGQFIGAMREQTAVALLNTVARNEAAQLEAEASIQAAIAQQQLADAALIQAEGEAAQAEWEGKASYSLAIGAMDEQALSRVRADEQYRADRELSQQIIDDVVAAITCIEADGAANSEINSRTGLEARAYSLKQERDKWVEVDGLSAAYRWHNLNASERLLVTSREALLKLKQFVSTISQEEMEWKINSYVPRCRAARTKAAKELVKDLTQYRAATFGGLTSIACVSFCLYNIFDSTAFALITTSIVCFALPGLLFLDKVKAPQDFDEIKREAGFTLRTDLLIYTVPAAICAVSLIISLPFFLYRTHKNSQQIAESDAAKKAQPRLAGEYTRGNNKLSIEPGWLILNLNTRLPIGTIDVANQTSARFKDAILKPGAIFDDLCHGTINRDGNQLTLLIEEKSAADCMVFAGEWYTTTPVAQTITGQNDSLGHEAPCTQVKGKWAADLNAPIHTFDQNPKVLQVEDRTIKIYSVNNDGSINQEKWIAWNSKDTFELEDFCAFNTKELLASQYSFGISTENPYAAIDQIRLRPLENGIELFFEPPNLSEYRCKKSEASNCTKEGILTLEWQAKTSQWFESLNQSFWKTYR